MSGARTLLLTACLALGSVAPAAAQAGGRVEVSAGVRWMGAISFGAVPADETTAGNGRRPLFESDTRLDGSVGGTATVSVRVARRVRVEGAVAYNPTGLSTRITADAEGVGNTTITAPVSQFLIEGGMVAEVRRAGRFTPFVTGGLGYLRQLNDGRTLVETGRSVYVGGGLYYVRASARPRRVKATGARLDLRAVFLRDGVLSDSSLRGGPAVTAALFARF